MRSICFKLSLAIFLLLSLNGCDRGKNCKCTTSFSGTGSAGMADQVEVHEFFDRTSDPDCSFFEGTDTDVNGLVSTTICEAVWED